MTRIVECIITAVPKAAAALLVVFFLVSPTSGPANAQSPMAGASLQDFLACQEIEKRKKRYKCYDAVEAGPAQSTTAAAVPDAVQQRQEFGQPAYVKDEKKISGIIVQIVSATLGRSRKWTFRTRDGQIWRQVNSRRARYKEQNFEAEIKKASLGGFSFKEVGSKIRLRVKRIK